MKLKLAPANGTTTFINFMGEEFIRIPPGTFLMGAVEGDIDAEENERPAHLVTINIPFYLARYPVTLGLYNRFCTFTPRDHSAFEPSHAVNYISWNEATYYIEALNKQRPASEAWLRYRLPTEAEWEYACRAGTTTRFSYGDDPNYRILDAHAWYGSNSWDVGNCHPRPVGQKLPNAWGLHDMHGNVWEWTSDAWRLYGSTNTVHLAAHDRPKSLTRVLRGGGFCHEARYLRASDRDHYESDYRHYYTGFRLAFSAIDLAHAS